VEQEHRDLGDGAQAARFSWCRAATAVAPATCPPERRHADPEEHEARQQREEAGEAVAGGRVNGV
jgi:hypothetical protein